MQGVAKKLGANSSSSNPNPMRTLCSSIFNFLKAPMDVQQCQLVNLQKGAHLFMVCHPHLWYDQRQVLLTTGSNCRRLVLRCIQSQKAIVTLFN